MRRITGSLPFLAAVTLHGCTAEVSEEQRRLTAKLVVAAGAGNTAEVDRLIAAVVDVNGEAGLGTPLEEAVDRGNVAMIRHLVGKGLHLAASSGSWPRASIRMRG